MHCLCLCYFFFQAEDGIRYHCVTGVQTCALFFQAEDGIRDHCVTGVQTCALPISPVVAPATKWEAIKPYLINRYTNGLFTTSIGAGMMYGGRSEERRVGKECRSRWSPYH